MPFVKDAESQMEELRSEMNSTAYIIEELHLISMKLDNYAMAIGDGHMFYLISYVNGLNCYYGQLSRLMTNKQRFSYEERFRTLLARVYRKEGGITWQNFMIAQALHRDLLQRQQSLGLGLFAERKNQYQDKYLKKEFK